MPVTLCVLRVLLHARGRLGALVVLCAGRAARVSRSCTPPPTLGPTETLSCSGDDPKSLAFPNDDPKSLAKWHRVARGVVLAQFVGS